MIQSNKPWTAANGVPFNVRIVQRGDRYGLNDALTYDGRSPLVEFYDARYIEGFTPLGQFVARYFLHTLTGDESFSNGDWRENAHGINLDAGVKAWQIDGNTLADIARWTHAALERAS